MATTTVFPTHTCFTDMLEFLELRVKDDPPLAYANKAFLVHGICLKPDDQTDGGERFAHAWVEEGEEVTQSGLLNGELVYYSIERTVFAQQLRIQDATRYTLAQVCDENVRSGHYGPWLERYRALLGRKIG